MESLGGQNSGPIVITLAPQYDEEEGESSDSDDSSLECASLLDKAKHVSLTVTKRTFAFILQLYFMLQSREDDGQLILNS